MKRKGWAITIVVAIVIVGVIVNVRMGSDTVRMSNDEQWIETVVSGTGEDRIVQLFIEGVIADGGGSTLGAEGFSARTFIAQLERVKEDRRVKAVVIRVDSPGGTVNASEDIHNEIEALKKAGKVVVVSMGDTAASGGYYVSAPANRIFASNLTITGSLGVIFSIPNYQKAAEWIGYEEVVIKSGQFKDIGNALREMTAEERGIFQTLIDESYARFVQVIAQGRNMTTDQVKKIADGRIYSGQQALKLNLIDEIGGLEEATQYAIKQSNAVDPQIIQYEQPFTWSSLLLGLQSAVQSAMPTATLTALIPAEHRLKGLLYVYR